MGLRTKLLVSIVLVVVTGISLASIVVYVFARNEFEKATRTHLEQSAEILVTQSGAWLKEFRSDVILWAALPIVRQVARAPRNRPKVAEACRSFKRIVETHEVYQSINLLTTEAACIASSIESRVGLKRMQEMVLTRLDFKMAASGKTFVSPTLVSRGTGRPCIAISTPVWEGKKVVGVLRAIVDLAFYGDFVLRWQETGHHGRASILDLDLDMRLPAGFVAPDTISGSDYHPPEIPLSPGDLSSGRGLIQYRGKNGDYLAAFHKVEEPDWIIVVEQPLKEVLAPIHSLAKTAFVTAILLLATVLGVVFLIMNPRLRDILKCLHLVKRIESGDLGARLHLHSRDEIGALAEGLNVMADSLARNRQALEKAREAESSLVRSRLQALRYQLNPHFLFNVLNSIDALSKQAPQRIPELIHLLSRYLRSTLTDGESNFVPLSQEIDIIASYLKLEKVRFEENLVVDLVFSPEATAVLVPELLIQPLVENAIKYGMKTSTLPLYVTIQCTVRDDRLEVKVANTGRWVSEAEEELTGRRVGLTNLRKRLDLSFSGHYDLAIEQPDGWVVVKVELPLSEAHDGAE
jgi:HAMP domain-containing protein